MLLAARPWRPRSCPLVICSSGASLSSSTVSSLCLQALLLCTESPVCRTGVTAQLQEEQDLLQGGARAHAASQSSTEGLGAST